MKILFLRFYIGVIVILAGAWLLQTWLYDRLAPQYAELARDVYFGGVRIARQKYLFGEMLERRGDKGARQRLFDEISQEYDFPVQLVERDPKKYPRWDIAPDSPEFERDPRYGGLHLCDGLDHGFGEGGFIMARLEKDRKEVLVFGPLPKLVGPPVFERVMGVGTVLAMCAVGIALLLRPVSKQFQLVESTAQQIAGGDLTARIGKEGRVGSTKLAGAFNNMADRTETMVRTQKELLQAVSHELRTPLSRIHFGIDLIRDAPPGEREEKLKALELASDDLDKIVSELMSYVRMENAPTPEPSEIVVADAIDMLFEKQAIISPNVQLSRGDGVNAGLSVSVDPDGFDRAMQNLISNAAKYGKGKVRVEAKTTADHVVIDVDDDGPGIAESDRDRVFDPFVRLSQSSGTGVGLGLAIVRRIANRNGGDIEIAESPLGGCRVRTTWPVRSTPVGA